MILSDLKVVSANVQVSNENMVEPKYKIQANFRTKNGEVKCIDSGSVIVKETSSHVSSFNRNLEFEESLHVTYLNEAAHDVEVQCEINQLIDEFVSIATTKALEEAVD